ncbi:MAG: hypothetical protein OEY94_06375 [Alphaproteobacteria bacterium]|nr:hypothetical protein [Alphaproteobacteria bacterium]
MSRNGFLGNISDVLANASADGGTTKNVLEVQAITRNTLSREPFKLHIYDIASYLGKQKGVPDEVHEAVITLSKMAAYPDTSRDQLGQTVQGIVSYLDQQEDVPDGVRAAVQGLTGAENLMVKPESTYSTGPIEPLV